MRILYVCTANICRSASAQRLLLDAVAAAPELAGIEVRSAGTHAMPGSPGCSLAPALTGLAADHRSQALTADLVAWADLILAAARDHRPSILEIEPSCRTRTFTIRQAGRIADRMVDSGIVAAGQERARLGGESEAWAERFPVGDPRADVQAMPDDRAGRGPWIVSEMDAARGLAGAPPSPSPTGDAAEPRDLRKWWRLPRGLGTADGQQGSHLTGASGLSATSRVTIEPSELHADDVPDPHYLGAGLHPLAFEHLQGSTVALVRLLREVASAG